MNDNCCWTHAWEFSGIVLCSKQNITRFFGAVPFWLILRIRKVLVILCAKTQLQLSSDFQAVIRIGGGHQIKLGALIEHCNYHPPTNAMET